MADDEVATWFRSLIETLGDFCYRFRREIDKDVSAKDNIERPRDIIRRFDEISLLKI